MASRIDTILVVKEDFEEADLRGKSACVLDFVDGLLGAYYEFEEMPEEAVQIYWLDFYAAQLANGGPAQFVFKCRWEPQTVEAVRKGLPAIGAKRHAALFEGLRERVAELGAERLETLLSSTYFDDNPERDFLNSNDQAFFDALKEEDIAALIGTYIESLDNVKELPAEEWRDEMIRLIENVPDREAREARAKENVHRYQKIAQQLSDFVGEEFDRFTEMGFLDVDGNQRPMIFFLTDKGLRAMVLGNGQATLVDEERSGRLMAVYPCPEAVFDGDHDLSILEPRLLQNSGGLFGG